MKKQFQFVKIGILIMAIFSILFPPQKHAVAQAGIQDNQIIFNGRRGTEYSAIWDTETYEINFTTPDSTFPWDWIGFTGQHGSVALSGLPNLETTFDRSDSSVFLNTMPGDIWRIKGSGIVSLAHLTKIGLVIGNGVGAQRAWFSDGTITEYYMAPHYIGYRVQVLGRTADVKLTSLNPQNYHAVIAIEVTLDDPTNAHLVFVSDLEPAMDYSTAVTIHNRATSQVNFDTENQVISGYGGGVTAFIYSDQPLESWSANDLAFSDYLATDSLDEQLASGSSDARSALRISAQSSQYFYVGTMILDTNTRTDPTASWYGLRDDRLNALNEMPQIESVAIPKFEFANFISNLTLNYLINPNGGLHYTDKAFLYTPDSMAPLIVTPHTLPKRFIDAFRDGISLLANQQYSGSISDTYGLKYDNHTWIPLPNWFGGNFPDIIHFNSYGNRVYRENYSDVYPTATFITSLYHYYLLTGDLEFTQIFEDNIDNAITGLQSYDSNYDSQYGEDGNLFPNIIVPMSDLGLVAGEYPSESAQTVYAYEDAAEILRLYDRNSEADSIIANFAVPMRNSFDAFFWDTPSNYYMATADQRSNSRESGTMYNDWWSHVGLIPIFGNLGLDHRDEILTLLTNPVFYESTHDIHWLSLGSENFITPGRWGFPTNYTNGWSMEGGYLLLPNAIIPINYFNMSQTALAEIFTNNFFDKLIQDGPFEVIVEYDNQMPGRVAEASLYTEPLVGITQILNAALNIEVNGTDVTISPRLTGQFSVENLNITSLGLTIVLNYERDNLGNETITIISNEGLNIDAPNAQYRHNIELNEGWNMISSYVNPANPNMSDVFGSIQNDLVLAKNGAGQVFWPEYSINQIGNWNVHDAYQVYMISNQTLPITGTKTIHDGANPIYLSAGWNMVAYLGMYPQSIETALGDISDTIVLAKNGAGQVYWPAYGVNDIGDMIPGQGYQIYLSADDTLIYPANGSQ